MEFKIYDILSSLIHGVICLGTAMQLFGWSFQDYGAMYFAALSFCIGYLINTIGSWLQKPLFWSFGGMPTKQLLRKQKGKTYAGISSIPFYFSEELVDALKKDLQVDSIIDDKFSELMQQVARQGENIRIKDFNCSYAFSRSMLISSLIISTAGQTAITTKSPTGRSGMNRTTTSAATGGEHRKNTTGFMTPQQNA